MIEYIENKKFLKFDENNYVGLLDLSLIRIYKNYWALDEKYNKKSITFNKYGACIECQRFNEIYLLNNYHSDEYRLKNKNLDYTNFIGFRVIDFSNFNENMLPQVSSLKVFESILLKRNIGKYSRRIFIKKPILFSLFDIIEIIDNGYIISKYILPFEHYIDDIIRLINTELSLKVIYNKIYDKFFNYILFYSNSDFEKLNKKYYENINQNYNI